MAGKEKVKKVFRIIGEVILYLFLALSVFFLVLTITSKKDPDGAANLFGYQIRFVQSASMEKCDQTDVSEYEIKDIPVKSAIFIETVPESAEKAEAWYASLKKGDVVTFRYLYVRQETITHRIVDIRTKTDDSGKVIGYLIDLEGDNKSAESDTLAQTIDTSLTDSPNYIVGKVTGINYFLGLLIYALKTPVGICCFVILPSLIVIVLEVIRIANTVGKDKKEQKAKIEEAQRSEIEELRRRLAALENNKPTDEKNK